MDPTLRISIDRTSLSLPALVLSGDDGLDSVLAVVGFTEPAIQARVKYAPTSDWAHGEMPLGFSLQQTMLNFDVATLAAASESEQQSAIAELTAAILRLQFSLTRTTGDYSDTWSCQAGAVVPSSGRTYTNLVNHNQVWQVSIPAYPVRSF